MFNSVNWAATSARRQQGRGALISASEGAAPPTPICPVALTTRPSSPRSLLPAPGPLSSDLLSLPGPSASGPRSHTAWSPPASGTPEQRHSSRYAAADELTHRECLPPSTVTEIPAKNEGSYGGHHTPAPRTPPPPASTPQSTRTASRPKPLTASSTTPTAAAATCPPSPCPGKGEAKGEPEAPPAFGPRPGPRRGPRPSQRRRTRTQPSGSAHSAAQGAGHGSRPSR